jgi:hypothetical protein
LKLPAVRLRRTTGNALAVAFSTLNIETAEVKGFRDSGIIGPKDYYLKVLVIAQSPMPSLLNLSTDDTIWN